MLQFKLGKAVIKIKLGFFRELPAINCTLQPRADVKGDESRDYRVNISSTKNDSSRTITVLTSCDTVPVSDVRHFGPANP